MLCLHYAAVGHLGTAYLKDHSPQVQTLYDVMSECLLSPPLCGLDRAWRGSQPGGQRDVDFCFVDEIQEWKQASQEHSLQLDHFKTKLLSPFRGMAGKLFPEIFIGDSEDTYKKPPTGKNTYGTRRDVRLTSPLSADEESHQSNSLADSAERKEEFAAEYKWQKDGDGSGCKEEPGLENKCKLPAETGACKEGEGNKQQQKPVYMSLLDFGWLHEMGEEEEGKLPQDVPGNITEDRRSGLAMKEISGDGTQQELWTTFTSHTEDQLESRMSELGSFSHNFEIEGKITPPFSRPEHPENSPEDYESYCFLDEDSILSDSAVSTGYFPCYRTYVELPRYQPPRSTSSPPGDAEGRTGSSCDASIQCSGCSEEELTVSDTRDSDIIQGSKDQGEGLTGETIHSNPNTPNKGPLSEGNRHRTSGKELEGRNVGNSNEQHPSLEKRGFHPEVSESPKESEETITKEAASELLMQGNTSSGSVQTVVRKDLGQLPGAESQSSLLPSKGKAPRSLHSAATTKKPPLKKQQKQCGREDEDVHLPELAPQLGPGDGMPGRNRGSRFPCGRSPEMGHCEIEASGSGKEGRQEKTSPRSRPTTSGNPAGEEPRSTPSRLSLRSLVSWVRKIFRRSSTVQPQAGSSRGTEEARGRVGSRLRWWIYRRRNRIHPHYSTSHPPSNQ